MIVSAALSSRSTGEGARGVSGGAGSPPRWRWRRQETQTGSHGAGRETDRIADWRRADRGEARWRACPYSRRRNGLAWWPASPGKRRLGVARWSPNHLVRTGIAESTVLVGGGRGRGRSGEGDVRIRLWAADRHLPYLSSFLGIPEQGKEPSGQSPSYEASLCVLSKSLPLGGPQSLYPRSGGGLKLDRLPCFFQLL